MLFFCMHCFLKVVVLRGLFPCRKYVGALLPLVPVYAAFAVCCVGFVFHTSKYVWVSDVNQHSPSNVRNNMDFGFRRWRCCRSVGVLPCRVLYPGRRYNPKGWVGYGEYRPGLSAFLFTWRDGDTNKRAMKLRKVCVWLLNCRRA